MSSVLANILKINGQVVTRARLRALADRAARAKDKKFTGKLKRAIAAMDKAGVRSARINFDNSLIDQTFMPDSVKISELEGLYGIEVHGADLGEAKGGNTFFSEVSRRILEKIKEGTLPWRMPWSSTFAQSDASGGFHNYVTGKAYRGANFNMCLMFGGGETSFITEIQAEERGGKIVDRNDWIPICYFVRSRVSKETTVKDPSGNEERVTVEEVLQGMRWYKVYPLRATADVKPVTRDAQKKPKGLEFTPVKAAERIVSSYPGKPPISHGGNRAFYMPGTDSIRMPPKESFQDVPAYYSVLFHELIHSTGHPKRLDRLKPGGKESKNYAAEELVAELGSSFLCAICKIDYFTLDRTASYLEYWASKLSSEIRKDKSFFMRQQFASMRAVRFMMGPLWKTWNNSLDNQKPGKASTPKATPATKKPATTKASKPKTASKPATPKPAPKPAEPEKIKGLPVGFKGAFYGWGFTIQVQLEIDNQVALEIWENGGNVVARIHGRKPVERETAQHNIWQRIPKETRDSFFDQTKREAQKRIKMFVEALYKDAQQENRRRAKLGSAKAAPVKTNKAAWAKYAAIIGKSQPAGRVKKKGSLSGADQEKVVLKVKALSTKQAKKLGLGNGNVVLKAGNTNFGLKHILKRHQDEFQTPESAMSFTQEVLQEFSEIRIGKKDRPVFVRHTKRAIAILELEAESNHLRVITAYTMSPTQINSMPLLWIRPAMLGSQLTPRKSSGFLHTHTEKRGDVAAFGTGKVDGNGISKQQNPGQKSNGLRIVKAEELAGIQIETLKLQGVWGKWLGQPATNFDLLLSGSPGGGKSTLLLQFAHYLANDLKKRVLFVSKEEFGSATLAEKVQRLKIKNVHFTNTITPDALLQGDYDVVFIDSITDLRFSVHDYKRLRELNPEVAFLLIAQQTKGGKFKGNNEWPHETEIVAEVADGEAWCTKNRYSLNKQPILIPGYVQ
ncbi:MAG: zincin-like metallopeptidase domain-containing protein [Bacteroidota bacterium]